MVHGTVREAVAAQTDAHAVFAGRGRAPWGRRRTREVATGSAPSAAESSGPVKTPPSLLGAGRRGPGARRPPRGGGGAPRFAENCQPQVGERPCARRLGSIPQHRAPSPRHRGPLRCGFPDPGAQASALLGLRLLLLILAFTQWQFSSYIPEPLSTSAVQSVICTKRCARGKVYAYPSIWTRCGHLVTQPPT